MKKNIFITGDMGFIGGNLIDRLGSKGKDKKYSLYGVDLQYRENLFGSKTEELVKKADVVYHLAAFTNVSDSFDEPEAFFINNVLGTARIVELCLRYKKKLIYPSSAAIYHPELSPYGYTKKVAEDIVKGVGDKIPTVILRLFNVYGQDMNPNSGSIMYRFLNDKKLTIYGDGEQTRDFVNVEDVVSIMEDAMKKKWDGKIVEVGMGKPTSTNYVAGLFAHYRKKKLNYMPPKREIKWSFADRTMLNSLYKKPLVSNLAKDIKTLCNQI